MPRPTLGSAARTIQAGLKISTAERDDLIVEFGSVGLGLRALLDLWYEMRQPVDRSTIPDAPSRPVPVAEHRHKRDQIIRTEWDSGMKIDVWACACGEELR